MKYDKGQLTFDFKRSDSYIPFVAIVIVLMFGDNLFIGKSTDTKIYMLVCCLFSYAFLYLLYHFFPAPVESNNPKSTDTEEVEFIPPTIFKHDDEASRVELKMHKEIRKIPIEESETDGEEDDFTSPSKRNKQQKTSSSSSQRNLKPKVKKQEVIVVDFKSWSKHPNKFQLYYWLGWLGYKHSKVEVVIGQGRHEYTISGV